jgi:hypothetical protein
MMPARASGHEQAAEARAERHHETGGDLHSADHVHGVLSAARDEIVELRRELLGPVGDHLLGELVEAEQDRRDRECDAQEDS